MSDVAGIQRNWHRLRPEERRAAAVLEAARAGVIAVAHDDNSRASMHDIDLVRDGVVIGAVEVTAAADAAAVELWNIANGSDDLWTEEGLEGGWAVTLHPLAPYRRIKAELPGLLRLLEAGASDVDVADLAGSLRVLSLRQGDTSFPGSIYLTIERPDEDAGELVPDGGAGDAISQWVSDFLAREDQRHNIDKITAAGRPEGHVFLLLPGFTPAPWDVQLALMRDDATEPAGTPRLPAGVTHVWLMSSWSTGPVFSWSAGAGWRRHAKVDPPSAV